MEQASCIVNVGPSNRPGLEKTMTSKEPQDPSPVEDFNVVRKRRPSGAAFRVALLAVFAVAGVGVLLMTRHRGTPSVSSAEPADA